MNETKVILRVNSVVGTGDPFDQIMLIPLIADWGVPRQCVFCWMEGKRGKEAEHIDRLLVLGEPFDGKKVVGSCETHYRSHGGGDERATDPTASR